MMTKKELLQRIDKGLLFVVALFVFSIGVVGVNAYLFEQYRKTAVQLTALTTQIPRKISIIQPVNEAPAAIEPTLELSAAEQQLHEESIAIENQVKIKLEEEHRNKPYLTQLPLKTEHYYILYSANQDQIVVFLFGSASVDELRAKYQPEVERQLRDIGFDPAQETVDWQAVPETAPTSST